MQNRTLYFGDNLEILKKKIPDESFDLIYLDPPFNSSRSYNVLFKEGLQDSPAQIRAFEDSWHWTRDSKQAFDYLVRKTNQNISNLMLALEQILGHNDVLAYLSMMTVRLIELHRVLKKTGSLYLHCDPTASHYLKIVLDVIFGKRNFRNEIVWTYRRWPAKSRAFQRMHDILFFYVKDGKNSYTFNTIYQPLADITVKIHKGKKQRATFIDGRRLSRDQEEESVGTPLPDYWYIPAIAGHAKERLGYPTQKPEALLKRIIEVSSNQGDWILDPFCGCGTTIAVAEKLERNWVGIDITVLAINLIKHRLRGQNGLGRKQIHVDGLPTDLTSAKELFKKDPFEFEYWALDMVNAMPAQSKSKENMRGADKGIDGIIRFHRDKLNGKSEYGQAIVQVKGGKVQRNQIATLKSDVEREKAEAGIFITLEKATKPMQEEAIDAGTFTVPLTNKFEFPKIQILTVEELLQGKRPNLPRGLVKNYYKEAKPSSVSKDDAKTMGFMPML
ncbi:restriction endonuclease [Patescibacteria group bacterium]|nr:restriction endonuclease [Patescibacteria group bacterium]MBU4512614.1 restriction endonuclease [Patescibacteria group bacterium]MCG2693337.1 restriction endonuclease [Candidatus Parcubacteria bacterium]